MPINACIVTPYFKSLEKEQGGVGTHYTDLVSCLAPHLETLHLIYVATEPLDEKTLQSLPQNLSYHFLFDGWISHPKFARLNRFLMSNGLTRRLVRILQNLRVLFLVTWLNRKHRIDIVETTNYSYLCLLLQLLLPQIPLVVRISSFRAQLQYYQNEDMPHINLVAPLENMMIRLADSKLTHTKAHAQIIQEILGVRMEKISIIPHATEIFEPHLERDFSTNEVHALFVGRLEPRKGIQHLIEALPACLDQQSNLRFRIAGDDPEELGKAFLLSHPEYGGRVDFLGEVTNEELAREYQNCDFLVAPSLYESFGLIYIEAMAHGKPCIGTHSGGIPEVIKDGTTGILIQPGNVAELQAAILKLASSTEVRSRMSQAAYKRVQSRFSLEKLGHSSACLYRNILA